MPTLIEHQIARQENAEQRERDYYRFEEATDIAERLGYPIDHAMQHEIIGGYVYDAKLVRIADYTQRSLDVAPKLFYGDAAFEVTRREIEHYKTLRVEALARGELGGNTLIEYSPAPKAVLEGTTSINGYRPDLRRDMVRIYTIIDTKVHFRLFTLDQVSPATRQKVGDFLGIDMPPQRSDEAIMSDETVCQLSLGEIDGLVERTKLIHDVQHYQETGERTLAGSHFLDQKDALSIVLSHSDLMDEHMQVWSEVIGQARGKSHMEQQRQLTTAAIDLRLKGREVSSSSEGAVVQNAQSGNFDAGCSTGMNDTSTNTLDMMGMSRGKKQFISKVCPMCGETNVVTKIEGSIISGNCGCARDICTNEEISVNRRKKQRTAEAIQPKKEKPVEPPKSLLDIRDEVRAAYGKNAEVTMRIGIGESYAVVYDRVTQTVIKRL